MDGQDEHLNPPRSVADLSELPSRQRVVERDESMDAAAIILAEHRLEPDDGTCAGCLAQWDRWISHADCPQVAWALRVVGTPGGRDDNPLT